MSKSQSVYVAGHRGLAGSAIVRRLQSAGYTKLITRAHSDLDLTRQTDVEKFFAAEKPEVVILAAAKVGGILANSTQPAEFIYENLAIETNVIHAAYKSGVKKFVFLGSSCIYPRLAPQPMKEEHLLTSALEPTNEPYAIAKIAGLKMCEAYRKQYGMNTVSLMPTNLYGPGDNFDDKSSHVLAALIARFSAAKASGAKKVTVWGTGTPRREFMHVDDLASAVEFVLDHDVQGVVNVGTGVDVSIRELAEMIAKTTGFAGGIEFDTTKPDGTPRKLLDVSVLANKGWRASIALEQGLKDTVAWFTQNQRGRAAV